MYKYVSLPRESLYIRGSTYRSGQGLRGLISLACAYFCIHGDISEAVKDKYSAVIYAQMDQESVQEVEKTYGSANRESFCG